MKNATKTTVCPSCGNEYDKKEKECPSCGYRIPLSFDKFFWVFVVVLILSTFFYIYQNSHKVRFFPENIEMISQKIDETNSYDNVQPNKMENLSYLSIDEILQKRKDAVKKSEFFKDIENYSPRKDVYQIEDKLPWISIYELARYGTQNSKDISKGPSRQSISILNPEVLLSLLTPEFTNRDNEKFFSEYDYYFPTKILTNKKDNIIEVHFDISNFYKINPQYIASEMYMDDTNARDFNYDWVYASKSKNITYLKSTNFSNHIYKLQGYYHKGTSCKLESGCNNYSPYQIETIYRITDTPAFIEYKLWKQKPSSFHKKADITYRMVFD